MLANAEPWLPNDGAEPWAGSRFADVRFVAETGSTNADLLAAAGSGTTGPLVLVTGHQHAGRGRQDRAWFDRAGDSLLVSVLVTAEQAWADLVPLAAGLAAERAVNRFLNSIAVAAGRNLHDVVALKWPNDLLVPALDERKLAGILIESTASVVPASLAVVIGMGLNLRWSSKPPDDVQQRATTLIAVTRRLAGATLPEDVQSRLLGQYLDALDAALATLAGPDGRSATIAEYRSRCLTVGRSVELVTPTEKIVGRAVGIGDSGELLIETAVGGLRSVTAGDAHHRPSG